MRAGKPNLAVKAEIKRSEEEAGNIAGTNNTVFEWVRFTCATVWEKLVCAAFPISHTVAQVIKS